MGRRKDRLDAFVRKHEEVKADGIRFEISDREHMAQFVRECVVCRIRSCHGCKIFPQYSQTPRPGPRALELGFQRMMDLLN